MTAEDEEDVIPEFPDGYTPPNIHMPVSELDPIENELSPLGDYSGMVENHIGCRPGDLSLMKTVLDLYSLYHGIFLRSCASYNEDISIDHTNNDGETKQIDSEKGELVLGVTGVPIFSAKHDHYISEFLEFEDNCMTELKSRNVDVDQIEIELRSRGISETVADNYWKYITGEDIASEAEGYLLSPRRDMSCAWPLGCPQNIALIEDGTVMPHFTPRYAGRLSRERDHCRPSSITKDTPLHPAQNALQPMCKYHNRLKREMPLWDIETLHKIFSSDLP